MNAVMIIKHQKDMASLTCDNLQSVKQQPSPLWQRAFITWMLIYSCVMSTQVGYKCCILQNESLLKKRLLILHLGSLSEEDEDGSGVQCK